MMTTQRILRNGSINHKVPHYVITSNDSTVLVPNTFTTSLFRSTCNVCYSGNVPLCTFAHIKQWRRLVLPLASAFLWGMRVTVSNMVLLPAMSAMPSFPLKCLLDGYHFSDTFILLPSFILFITYITLWTSCWFVVCSMFIYLFCLISIYFQARCPLIFTSIAHYSLWYSSFPLSREWDEQVMWKAGERWDMHIMFGCKTCKPFGRQWNRWVYNTTMDSEGGVDWSIQLVSILWTLYWNFDPIQGRDITN